MEVLEMKFEINDKTGMINVERFPLINFVPHILHGEKLPKKFTRGESFELEQILQAVKKTEQKIITENTNNGRLKK